MGLAFFVSVSPAVMSVAYLNDSSGFTIRLQVLDGGGPQDQMALRTDIFSAWQRIFALLCYVRRPLP